MKAAHLPGQGATQPWTVISTLPGVSFRALGWLRQAPPQQIRHKGHALL